MRPALYGAWHGIEPVSPRTGDPHPGGRRRTGVRDDRHARRRPRRCRPWRSATCSRFATSAPTARSWRPTTTSGRWRPKSWWTAADRALDSPPPDDRRHAAVGRLMLIAFEGLDQSGKETQARQLRTRLEQDGRTVRAAVVPRLRDAHRPARLRRALAGERDFGPEVMQLLYVANRFEHKPRLDALARGRRHRRLRPVPGVERGVRRGAGTRRRLARGDPAPSAAAAT